jgi:uncharacterized membrane protein
MVLYFVMLNDRSLLTVDWQEDGIAVKRNRSHIRSRSQTDQLCVLCAVCCVLCAVCCVLCAVCCMLCAVCCVLCVLLAAAVCSAVCCVLLQVPIRSLVCGVWCLECAVRK